jgi:TatD DNase family protein
LKKIIPYTDVHTHHIAANDVISIYNCGIELPPGTEQFVSIGIHPWHIRKYDIREAFDLIRKNTFLPGVKAIGECGLDKLSDIPLDEQVNIFEEQIKIAIDLKKPLIIHCVKAFDELIRIKKKSKAIVPFIIHGYNNNEQIAEQLLKNDFYLSFGKALLITDSNAQKVITKINTTQFFLETDDASIPISSIFEKAAELKKISVNDLKEKMMLNFKLLFNYE